MMSYGKLMRLSFALFYFCFGKYFNYFFYFWDFSICAFNLEFLNKNVDAIKCFNCTSCGDPFKLTQTYIQCPIESNTCGVKKTRILFNFQI